MLSSRHKEERQANIHKAASKRKNDACSVELRGRNTEAPPVMKYKATHVEVETEDGDEGNGS